MLKPLPLQMPKSAEGVLQFGDLHIPYQLIRCAKRKRNLAFDFNGAPHLVIRSPAKLSYAVIQATLQKHAAWLCSKWEQRSQAVVKRQWCDGETIPLLGKNLILKIVPTLVRKITCQLNGEYLEVTYPLAWPQLAEKISTAVTHWLKLEASKVLHARTVYWSTLMTLQPNRIIITSPRMRWGSCDAQNNLRFNWRIVMATAEMLDYLVVHEIAHIAHKHHGPSFWKCVLTYLPNTSALRKQLRNWQPDI